MYDMTDPRVVEVATMMRQTLETLLKFTDRKLLPPPTLPSNQAKGYMEGSNAAFQQCAKLSQFALEQINDKLKALTDEPEKASEPALKGVGGLS
jgi:hypothetical protein